VRRRIIHRSGIAGVVGALLATTAISTAQSQQISNNVFQTNVQLTIVPFAMLQFDDPSPTLYLEIPPGDSTIPSSGVEFVVTGNANATLVAEPSAFVEIPGVPSGQRWMGKAALGTDVVGYKLELRFPDSGHSGPPPSNIQFAALPGFEEGPTTPPLTVNLSQTAGSRTGVLHMEASHEWTPHGGLPLPGIHVGQVVLTLTPST
jgi:hypothetical protein